MIFQRVFMHRNTPRLLCSLKLNYKSLIRSERFLSMSAMKQSRVPHVIVEPKVALADCPVHIKVTGLDKHQPVSIASEVKNDGGRPFRAYSHYTSDSEGVVDLKKDSSVGGGYVGVEPMGLFWSSKIPSHMEGRYSRLNKKDVFSPHVVSIQVHDKHLQEDDIGAGNSIASTTLERWYSRDIERVQIDEGGVRGVMFIPKGGGKYPGVIDLRGGGGAIMEARPSLLACHGFVTLALTYKGVGSPDARGSKPLDLDHFGKAVHFLLKHKNVHGPTVGMLGISSGGSMALATAGRVPEVGAVVAINSQIFALECGVSYKDQVWEPLYWNHDLIEARGDILYFLNAMSIPSYDEAEDKILPFYESKAPLLFIHSSDDTTAKLGELRVLAERKMKAAGKSNYNFIEYPDAGHLIEPPYSPLISATYFSRAWQAVVCYGGKTLPHARAQEDSWNKILKFFKKNLSENAKL